MHALQPLTRLWYGLSRLWSLHTWDGAAGPRLGASEARARSLLCRMLSASQLQEFETHGGFTVESLGRGRFCILPRTAFNVFHTQTGNAYCCNTEAFVPLFDQMLAQKLLLECDPDRFFAVANCRSEVFAQPSEQHLRRALNRERDRAPRPGPGGVP